LEDIRLLLQGEVIGKSLSLKFIRGGAIQEQALWWASDRTEETNVAVTGFGEVAEQLRRSTVLIRAGGSGSGVIWSADGVIVTKAHVARGWQVGVQLWDGRELKT
jgi:S1-C subfamily serine protease